MFLSNLKRLGLALGLGAAMLTSSVGLPGSVGRAADTVVRYAVDGFVLGTLIRVADAKGYFAEEGIDARLLTFSYGVDTVDAVLAGQADFGVIIDMPLLARFSSGKLATPAFIGIPNPGWHKLYVSPDYKSIADLKGKKIAVASGTAQEFVTRIHLRDNGIDPDKDVELVGLASLFEIIGAMKSGRVDTAWIWGQGIKELGDDPKFRFEADDSIVNQKTIALLVVAKDYLDNNRDTVLATLRALDKAAKDVASDLDEAAAIVAKGIAGDAEKIRPVIQGQNYALSFEAAGMASLKSKLDFLVASGVIDPAYDLNDYVDLEILREAAPSVEIVDEIK